MYRAIGTLEGMARSADPTFNVLAVVYGFAVQTLLISDSTALVSTLKDITYDKEKYRIDVGLGPTQTAFGSEEGFLY